jgi:hypothetical protein
MTNLELLEAIQNDLRKLNVNYEAHATIQQIMQAYKLRIENKQDE